MPHTIVCGMWQGPACVPVIKFTSLLPIHGTGGRFRNLCLDALSNTCLAGMYVYEMSGKIHLS